MKAMERIPTDDWITGIIGAIVGLFSTSLMNITWQELFENIWHFLGVGLIALFTGAMSVVGKHLIEKLIKRKKKTP